MDCVIVTDEAGNIINNHNSTALGIVCLNMSLSEEWRPGLETKSIIFFQVLNKLFPTRKYPAEDKYKCLSQYGIT